MKNLFAFLALFIVATTVNAKDLVVPEGFVLQPLKETDGQVIMPKDWHFKSEGTREGWLWTFSKEDTTKGPYDTGLRIQMILGASEAIGKTHDQLAEQFISGKRNSIEVIKDCPKEDIGDFYRQCIEVIEEVKIGTEVRTFHILYSLMWSKKMDMLIVSIFGTPSEEWEKNKTIISTMREFRLIGPNFGKKEQPAKQ
jgi:hypothetical protein